MRDLDGFRQFDALAREQSFSRAARAVHLSPSAFSRAIQRLEAEVGTQLVERAHHRVGLTPAGAAFLRTAREILDSWDRYAAADARTDAAALTGTLRIYCTVTAAQSLVPGLLARYRAAHPQVRIALETGYASDALQQLRSGTIDAVIAPLPPALPAGVVAEALTTTPIVLVAPVEDGPVRAALDRRPRDWGEVPLVLPARGSVVRRYVDEWLTGLQVRPTIYAAIEGHEAILSLVALGCGVGAIPRLVLDSSALRTRVVEVRARGPRPLTIALCARRGSASPLVAALFDIAALQTPN